MRTDPVAVAWAKALFEVAQAEDAVERVDAELATALDTISGHLKLRETLADPQVPGAKKAEILREVFGTELSPLVTNAVVTLAETGQETLLVAIRAAYEAVSEEVRNVAIADVTTAVELTDSLRADLKKQVALVAGKDIVLREHVDPEILGGIIIRVSGKIMDGSVKAKLARMREQMVGARGEA